MARLTRRAALATLGALGAGSVLGLRYAHRSICEPPPTAIRLTDGGGFMGADPADMNRYMQMFMRHNELNRVVQEIPGGVRTTTQSNSQSLPPNSRRMSQACTPTSIRRQRSVA